MKRVQREVIAPKRTIKTMSEEEAKVLAMLIDTEGTICATESHGTVYFTIRVGMSGWIPPLMVHIWGGKITKRFNKKTKNWHYTWIISPNSRRPFLEEIKPYLLQKQEQADLALKMCDVKDQKPDGYRERLEELRRNISMLNHKRVPEIDLTNLEGAVAQYVKTKNCYLVTS